MEYVIIRRLYTHTYILVCTQINKHTCNHSVYENLSISGDPPVNDIFFSGLLVWVFPLLARQHVLLIRIIITYAHTSTYAYQLHVTDQLFVVFASVKCTYTHTYIQNSNESYFCYRYMEESDFAQKYVYAYLSKWHGKTHAYL